MALSSLRNSFWKHYDCAMEGSHEMNRDIVFA